MKEKMPAHKKENLPSRPKKEFYVLTVLNALFDHFKSLGARKIPEYEVYEKAYSRFGHVYYVDVRSRNKELKGIWKIYSDFRVIKVSDATEISYARSPMS